MTHKVKIVVLYDDLIVRRVDWDGKHTLKRDNVLAIAILMGGKRTQSSISHDYYQLVWTDTDCCLTGHDGDYGFYPFEGGDPDWRFPFILPENSIEFTTDDAYVSKDDWQQALRIYADPNGGMF